MFPIARNEKQLALYIRSNVECRLSKNYPSLNLSHEKLAVLPDWFGNIVNKNNGTQYSIKQLDLDHNELVSLPDSISNIHSLKTLSVGDNRLISLPNTIGRLSQLTYLNVTRNRLTSLPDTIADLLQLQLLFLDNNNLLYVPLSIIQLPLLTLTLYNNYIAEDNINRISQAGTLHETSKILMPQKQFIWPALEGEGGVYELQNLGVIKILNTAENQNKDELSISLEQIRSQWKKEFNPRSSQKKKISPVRK